MNKKYCGGFLAAAAVSFVFTPTTCLQAKEWKKPNNLWNNVPKSEVQDKELEDLLKKVPESRKRQENFLNLKKEGLWGFVKNNVKSLLFTAGKVLCAALPVLYYFLGKNDKEKSTIQKSNDKNDKELNDLKLEGLLKKVPESWEQQKNFFSFDLIGKKVGPVLSEAEKRLQEIDEIYKLILNNEKYRKLYYFTRQSPDPFYNLPVKEQVRFIKSNLLKKGDETPANVNVFNTEACERFTDLYKRVRSFFDDANEHLLPGLSPDDVEKWAVERDKYVSKDREEYKRSFGIFCDKLHDPNHGNCRLAKDMSHSYRVEPIASTIKFLQNDLDRARTRNSDIVVITSWKVVEILKNLEYLVYGPQYYREYDSNGKVIFAERRRDPGYSGAGYGKWRELNIKEAMDELIDRGILELREKVDNGRCRFLKKCNQ